MDYEKGIYHNTTLHIEHINISNPYFNRIHFYIRKGAENTINKRIYYVLSDYKKGCWIASPLEEVLKLMVQGYKLCGFSDTEEGADALVKVINDEWNE